MTKQMPPLGDRLKGVILVYLNKTDLEMREFVYPYDPKWRPAIEARVAELDRYRLVNDGVNEEVLPSPLPREKGKLNWFAAGYCPYRGSGKCCGDPEEEDEW